MFGNCALEGAQVPHCIVGSVLHLPQCLVTVLRKEHKCRIVGSVYHLPHCLVTVLRKERNCCSVGSVCQVHFLQLLVICTFVPV